MQIYVENKCEISVAPDLLLTGAVSFSKLGKEKEQKKKDLNVEIVCIIRRTAAFL